MANVRRDRASRSRRFFFAQARSSTRRAEATRWRFKHILCVKQFNKYIGDKNASISRVEARLLRLRSRS